MAEIGTLRLVVIREDLLELLKSRVQMANKEAEDWKSRFHGEFDFHNDTLTELAAVEDALSEATDTANEAIELAYAEWQKTVPGKLMVEKLRDLGQRFGESVLTFNKAEVGWSR